MNFNKEVYQTYKYNIPYKNKELEMQLSGKFNLLDFNTNNNLVNHSLFISYTQKSNWQFLAKGSPFREHNYNPELGYKIKYNKWSFLPIIGHISNGETNGGLHNSILLDNSPTSLKNISRKRTRSWNYISLELLKTFKNFSIKTRRYIPIMQEKVKQNNDFFENSWE